MARVFFLNGCLFLLLTILNQNVIAEPQNGQQHEEDLVTQIIEDSSGEEKSHNEHLSNIQEDEHNAIHNNSNEKHEGGHDGGMEPLLFIILALIIGAATRHFFKKSPLPFTVMLLIIGVGLGLLYEFDYFTGSLESIGKGLEWAGHIDPHLILYVFLPILIFEAAFAMDVHTFKKSLGNAIILAVPGIIVALGLTAALIILTESLGIGFGGWNWAYALMFGAVVSATDPVAVVALLKELGASKKLGTLIEGESLLNDGTAIVIFMVIYLPIIGMGGDGSPFVEFLYVACGGTLLGVLFGYLVMAWVKKVFNDAFVEISIIIAAAYLLFFVAESFLHVSGVLGLVAFGLVMSGIGKTRISPEVGHFLHEFWELAAFFANVLIFIIVGVVIAERGVLDASANDYLLLFIIYIGIHVVRAFVIAMFYPIMKRTGYGLSKKDAVVVWYGALRGAIGLALALIVASIPVEEMAIALEVDHATAEKVIDQFLFLISGVVALTLLINATTIKFLVNRLGLTKIPAVKAFMMNSAFSKLRYDTENTLDLLKEDKFLGSANWDTVREFLPKMTATENSGIDESSLDTLFETRRRILEKEKSSYWHQFKDGLLGATAVRQLSDGINDTLDNSGEKALSDRPYLEKLWTSPARWAFFQKIPMIDGLVKSALCENMALSYDIAKGFVVAQEEVEKLVEGLAPKGSEKNNAENNYIEKVKKEISSNRMRGLLFLNSIRDANPEITAAIETKQAIRSILNFERNAIHNLKHEGRIEDDEAQKIIESVEGRMKKLMDSPPSFKLPNPHDLLDETAWLKGLDKDTIDLVKNKTQDKIYQKGQALMKEGDPGDGLFVIARGTVKVTVGELVVDMLGTGALIGEMAVLTGANRTANVIADTQVTALWLSSSNMKEIMSSSNDLKNQLWDTAGKRFAENLLGGLQPYQSWRQMQFRKWLSEGNVVNSSSLKENKLDLTDQVGILLKGTAVSLDDNTEKQIIAPLVLNHENFKLSEDAWVFVRGE